MSSVAFFALHRRRLDLARALALRLAGLVTLTALAYLLTWAVLPDAPVFELRVLFGLVALLAWFIYLFVTALSWENVDDFAGSPLDQDDPARVFGAGAGKSLLVVRGGYRIHGSRYRLGVDIYRSSGYRARFWGIKTAAEAASGYLWMIGDMKVWLMDTTSFKKVRDIELPPGSGVFANLKPRYRPGTKALVLGFRGGPEVLASPDGSAVLEIPFGETPPEEERPLEEGWLTPPADSGEALELREVDYGAYGLFRVGPDADGGATRLLERHAWTSGQLVPSLGLPGRAYVKHQEGLSALDLETGTVRWTIQGPGRLQAWTALDHAVRFEEQLVLFWSYQKRTKRMRSKRVIWVDDASGEPTRL